MLSAVILRISFMNHTYLFSDMDGTLLNSGGKVSAANAEAIREFQAAGGRFAVATGRSELITLPCLDGVEPNFPCILFNGAAVYDFGEKRFLMRMALAPDVVKRISDTALSVYPEVCIEAFTEGPHRLFNRNGVEDHLAAAENQPRIYEDYDPEKEYVKLLLYGENAALVKVAEAIAPFSEGNFHAVFSQPFYLEILPAGCSKGKALRWIIENLNVSTAETAAIGDFDNDAEMIHAADLGAAPGNGSEQAVASAEVVVADNDHDAVAELIRSYILDETASPAQRARNGE